MTTRKNNQAKTIKQKLPKYLTPGYKNKPINLFFGSSSIGVFNLFNGTTYLFALENN